MIKHAGKLIRCCVPMTSMTSMTSQFQHEMRPVSLINDAPIIERILRHVGSGGVDHWVNEVCKHGVRIAPSTGPPAGGVIEPLLEDPMPDYDCNPPLWQM